MRNDLEICAFARPVLRLALIVFALLQTAGPGMTQSRSVPEDQVVSTVFVTIGQSTGSGFYLMTEMGASLVTAKHVLFDEKNNLKGDQTQLLSYSIARNSAGTLMTLDLKVLRESKRLRTHATEDVVVVDVATTEKPLSGTEARDLRPVAGVTLNRVAPEGIWGPIITDARKFDDVIVGNDVLLAGFPTSIGLLNMPQVDRLRPLLRRGIVAGRNDAKKTIIVDCPVFPGNSGGPVVQVDRSAFETKFHIIGLVSEFVPFDNSGWSAAVGGNATLLNSGFSVVVPMDAVLDLLK